jgi:hypothetical protein
MAAMEVTEATTRPVGSGIHVDRYVCSETHLKPCRASVNAYRARRDSSVTEDLCAQHPRDSTHACTLR